MCVSTTNTPVSNVTPSLFTAGRAAPSFVRGADGRSRGQQ